MQKDFSYSVKVDDMPLVVQHCELTADKADLARLAEILQVPAVKKMHADIYLQRQHGNSLLSVKGHIDSQIELESVVSLEKFDREYNFDFDTMFDTHPSAGHRDESNWREDMPEPIFGGVLSLADVVIEQIALRLEDYPRREGESFSFVSEFSDDAEVRRSPFEKLAKLKK